MRALSFRRVSTGGTDTHSMPQPRSVSFFLSLSISHTHTHTHTYIHTHIYICTSTHTHTHRLADVAGMRNRTVTISSAGKLFSLTGWRVGWVCGPKRLMAPVNFAHTHISYCAPTPLQIGIAAALKEEDGSFGGTASLFAGNFELLADAVGRGTGAKVCAAQGGYFLVADVSATGAQSDMHFVQDLATRKGVVCTPLSVFYLDPAPSETPGAAHAPCMLVRFTICKSREHIMRACQALLAP